MRTIVTETGNIVSFEKGGAGPPLVLLHGSFSDHRTNWKFVQPIWQREYTTYAVARPGRGRTPAAASRMLEDDARDAVALIESIGEPVALLGHSFGAHVALAAAAMAPALVHKLIVYEPPWTSLMSQSAMAPLRALAAAGDWEAFTTAFFRDLLHVPADELDRLRPTSLWPPMIADAPASLSDLDALSRYVFRPDAFIGLRIPVLLQLGTESPRHLYATDALAAVLRDVRVVELEGQAHEGMTTAPQQYAASVRSFLSPRSAKLASALQ
jgi:pimeloyl-ACP methyl ester carboxylesterase